MNKQSICDNCEFWDGQIGCLALRMPGECDKEYVAELEKKAEAVKLCYHDKD